MSTVNKMIDTTTQDETYLDTTDTHNDSKTNSDDSDSEGTPSRYQPDNRLTDDAERLRELYVHRDKTIREIAAHRDCDVSRTTVSKRLREYGITDDEDGADTKQDTSVSRSFRAHNESVAPATRSLAPAHGMRTQRPVGDSSVQWSRLND